MRASNFDPRANDNRLRLAAKSRRRNERRTEKAENIVRDFTERQAFARSNGIQFDRNLARHPIIMPASFSLSRNREPTAAVLHEIREVALFGGRQVMLHFEHVTHIDPAAALALCAEIYRVRNLRSRELVSGTYPRDPEVNGALKNMGFFRMLNILEREDAIDSSADPARPAYLRFITSSRADWNLADMFVGVVEGSVMQFTDLARQRLVRAIGEAINNTIDHSHPVGSTASMKNRWWLSASINVANKEIVIIILDQGVGIPATLQPNDYEQIRAFLTNVMQFVLSAQPSDGEMILAATAYRRSGTGSDGRGRGFHDMKEFIDVCSDGELRVLSNRGGYHYVGGQESFANFERSIEGTLIEWRFRHDGIVEMKDG